MDCITFSLEPVAPFRLDLTAWALRRRAQNIIDRWDGSTYRRVLVVQKLPVGILVLNRLASAFGPSVPKQGQHAHAFPSPENLSTLDPEALRPLGFSLQKARAVIELASSIAEKHLDLGELENLENEAAVNKLRKLRGVGRWSAEYALLRGLGRLDVFPADDVGARNRLRDWLDLPGPLDYERVRHAMARWKTYSGLIYFHLLLKGLSEAGFL